MMNKAPKDDLRESFEAYEAALSPLGLALLLGFIGGYLDKRFLFTNKFAMPAGAILGFVFGISRLIQFLKKENKKDNSQK